jgi:hypothetical protein
MPISKEKQELPIVSRVCDDGTIIELVYNGHTSSLCVWRGGDWLMTDTYEQDGQTLVPIPPSNNLLSHGAVLLPSEPVPYSDEASLIQAIQDYLTRYVDLSPEFVEVATAYVLLSWVYDAFPELPYLRFRGDFGSGKTRALRVIGSICNKAFFASAASTISPVFYTLDLFAGTLVLDEADFRYSDLQSDITKILNNGSARGFSVLRQTQNIRKEFEPRAFNVYGPKVLATRRSFEDDALESRFITEEMGGRAPRADIPISLPDAQSEEAHVLRNKLLLYRFHTLGSAGTVSDYVDRARSGRFNQVVVPLLSVMKSSEAREQIKAFSERNEAKMRSMRRLSIEGELAAVLCRLVQGTAQDFMTVGEVASALRGSVSGEFGRPITDRYVGHLLRSSFGLFTYKRQGIYVLPASEFEKVKTHAARFGASAT